MKKFIALKLPSLVLDKFFYRLSIRLINYRGDSSSVSGVTLFELLSAMLITGVILNLAFLGISWNRQLYLADKERNDYSQRINTVFDIVGSDIKQAGEGFAQDPNFPILTISQSGNNSLIRIRRNLLSGSLPLCRDIAAGSTGQAYVVGPETTGGTTAAGCGVVDSNNDGWPDILKQWKDYRTSNNGTVRAYIYDGSNNGEFFDYSGESTFAADGTNLTPAAGNVADSGALTASSHTWQNAYTAGGSGRIYLIEERLYQLDTNTRTLQLIINNNQTTNIVGNLTKFKAIAQISQSVSNNSTEYTCDVIPPVNSSSCGVSLPNSFVWTQIMHVKLTVKARSSNSENQNSQNEGYKEVEESETFFPRNVLNY